MGQKEDEINAREAPKKLTRVDARNMGFLPNVSATTVDKGVNKMVKIGTMNNALLPKMLRSQDKS